jgi:Sulfotransferase family
MPIFEKGAFKILFIHIPKTGGTTIEETFVRNGFKMSYRRGGRYGKLNEFDRNNGCSPQHMHADLLAKHFIRSDFNYVFCTVRHPESRFLSEWRSRKRDFPNVDPDCLDAVADHLPPSYARNPFLYDNHLRPQHEFLWGHPEVFRLEDGLQSTFDAVSERIGYRLRYQGLRLQAARGKPPSLGPRTRKFIHEFYREDFLRFGYPTEGSAREGRPPSGA